MIQRTMLAATFVLAVLAAVGCGPKEQYLLQPELESGRPFDYSLVPFLAPGSTTRAEARSWLGEPFVIDREGPYEIWHYYVRRVRDRYAEDWTREMVDSDHATIEEHAATLTFVGDLLHRVEDRSVPHFADNPWVREAEPNAVPKGDETGISQDDRSR
ncbi:MAG: hypothetical protein HY720_23515 [Planctomycetes bacterium]|nr:hypothetical protein [Planctomycetota bacterium]